MQEKTKLSFTSDYMEGAHPDVLAALTDTNLQQFVGYGLDDCCENAKDLIRKACEAPNALVQFLVGGTQTNATVIDALLRPYQGVVAAETGHIGGHEAGAIEACGHKVLPLKQTNGKIDATVLRKYLTDYYSDSGWCHTVVPGMVYISQPTEYGTLYSLNELEEIKSVCTDYKLPLYIDGARLAYGLACDHNDVMLSDLARVSDVFYIGGTKCGALMGEAVVASDATLLPNFFTTVKQHGALLAKGWLLGLQFEKLFTDNLYCKIGKHGVDMAERLRNGLRQKGVEEYIASPTNQTFVVLDNKKIKQLEEVVNFTFWEKYDDNKSVIRFVTDWATSAADVDKLLELI